MHQGDLTCDLPNCNRPAASFRLQHDKTKACRIHAQAMPNEQITFYPIRAINLINSERDGLIYQERCIQRLKGLGNIKNLKRGCKREFQSAGQPEKMQEIYEHVKRNLRESKRNFKRLTTTELQLNRKDLGLCSETSRLTEMTVSNYRGPVIEAVFGYYHSENDEESMAESRIYQPICNSGSELPFLPLVLVLVALAFYLYVVAIEGNTAARYSRAYKAAIERHDYLKTSQSWQQLRGLETPEVCQHLADFFSQTSEPLKQDGQNSTDPVSQRVYAQLEQWRNTVEMREEGLEPHENMQKMREKYHLWINHEIFLYEESIVCLINKITYLKGQLDSLKLFIDFSEKLEAVYLEDLKSSIMDQSYLTDYTMQLLNLRYKGLRSAVDMDEQAMKMLEKRDFHSASTWLN